VKKEEAVYDKTEEVIMHRTYSNALATVFVYQVKNVTAP
jgi:hypothetical protein